MIVILLVVVTIILVALICSIGGVIDYGEQVGYVINKEYTSSYTTTSMVYTGKVMIPTSHFHPEKWEIEIQKEEDRCN